MVDYSRFDSIGVDEEEQAQSQPHSPPQGGGGCIHQLQHLVGQSSKVTEADPSTFRWSIKNFSKIKGLCAQTDQGSMYTKVPPTPAHAPFDLMLRLLPSLGFNIMCPMANIPEFALSFCLSSGTTIMELRVNGHTRAQTTVGFSSEGPTPIDTMGLQDDTLVVLIKFKKPPGLPGTDSPTSPTSPPRSPQSPPSAPQPKATPKAAGAKPTQAASKGGKKAAEAPPKEVEDLKAKYTPEQRERAVREMLFSTAIVLSKDTAEAGGNLAKISESEGLQPQEEIGSIKEGVAEWQGRVGGRLDNIEEQTRDIRRKYANILTKSDLAKADQEEADPLKALSATLRLALSQLDSLSKQRDELHMSLSCVEASAKMLRAEQAGGLKALNQRLDNLAARLPPAGEGEGAEGVGEPAEAPPLAAAPGGDGEKAEEVGTVGG